ncbi:hypothetical protein IFO70_13460 [Phormidium tenue FACHB-886]|nr:hypothetical protein [Phormidium tenue FACHB-886]
MYVSKLGWAVGSIVVLGCGQAIAAPLQVAQAVETNCRQTNSATGVYEQPNVNSPSRGILPIAQTVQLEVLGTGTGWARISQPTVGWVEAQYLTPAVPCEGDAAAQPAETSSSDAASDTAGDSNANAVQDNRQSRLTAAERRSLRNPDAASSDPTSAEPELNSDDRRLSPDRSTPTDIAEVTAITCSVLPTYGLAVRSEPTVTEATYIDTIPQGTYRFQFTRNTLSDRISEGTRRWVYITAPVEGWISLGVVGREFTLGGDECG